MTTSPILPLGAADGDPVVQLGAMSNRHGLIAGATGTGKTVTLQVLAEGFSRVGVPVFAADVKGDLSGLAKPATPVGPVARRLAQMPWLDYQAEGSPVVLWDVFGTQGHPVRATLSEMGPLLLASALELNDTQEAVLYSAFRIADEESLLLVDLKDLRALLTWMSDNAKELRGEYGTIAPQSVGAIQRRLLVLEEQGGTGFFGEPALALDDLLRLDPQTGRGPIHLLDASRLLRESPRIYGAFLLWILAELFETLPERGDPDRPTMVLFFDEAHLLFKFASKTLLERIEQVVRLIRSKGVGVYFVTQVPADIPDAVLGQLGLKIQHALRAFTARDRRAIRATAESFPLTPGLDIEATLTSLGIGEALVSTLDESGRPTPGRSTLIAPPRSRIGPLSEDERAQLRAQSTTGQAYETAIDRESAYEVLRARAAQHSPEDSAQAPPRRRSQRQGLAEAFFTSAARSVGSRLGRELVRGVLGSLMGRR